VKSLCKWGDIVFQSDPFLFGHCNVKSFLGVEDSSTKFINFAMEASKALAFLNVICFDGGLTC